MNVDQTAHRSDLDPYCLQYRPQKCKVFNTQNKLDHDNINSRHIQNLDKFFKRVLKILSGREKNMMDERMDGRNDRQPKSYRPPPTFFQMGL